MTDHETTCKICKKPISVQADPDCEAHWLKVFLSMVTCDRCFDLREMRLCATGKLQALAQYLMAIAAIKTIKPEDRQAKRKKIREHLIYWTRQYAEWFSKFHHSPRYVVWNEEFADIILDAPHKLDEVLRQYRQRTRPMLQQPEAA